MSWNVNTGLEYRSINTCLNMELVIGAFSYGIISVFPVLLRDIYICVSLLSLIKTFIAYLLFIH